MNGIDLNIQLLIICLSIAIMSSSSFITDAKADPGLERDSVWKQYIDTIVNPLRYRGLLVQGLITDVTVYESIEKFPIRPDDIWLASYPKSGTTWTKEILSLIRADGDVEKINQIKIIDRIPNLDLGRGKEHIERLERIPAPRFLNTHMPVELIPEQLREGKAKVRSFTSPSCLISRLLSTRDNTLHPQSTQRVI